MPCMYIPRYVLYGSAHNILVRDKTWIRNFCQQKNHNLKICWLDIALMQIGFNFSCFMRAPALNVINSWEIA
jgi:hypothetical protein